MEFEETRLKSAFTIKLEPNFDSRGSFGRLYCKKEFENISHFKEILQVNYSSSLKKGTVRGLHYQVQPNSEIKIIRCLKGRVFDVIVDIRKNSDTFLKWYGVELSEDNMKMIYVPEGFAHGIQALVDNCEILYLDSAYYSKADERGLRYNDLTLNINWPLKEYIVSEKDENHPLINEYFEGL